jgi:hypothetical protein
MHRRRCSINGSQIPGFIVAAMVVVGAAAVEAAFPDAHNPPPTGWTGPVFKLSQNYPTTLPSLEPASSRRWTQFDFTKPTEAPPYIKAVLDYCLEGNTATNFADVSQNPVRTWYHSPWLHSTASGREFIHGLTKERSSRARELGPAQTTAHDNWAVGFYNARGAFTIGQVWQDPVHPDPRKGVFPSDTVACKLLFTTASLAQVPFLEGSLQWQADINRATGTGVRPTVRLLQLDVAVKDARANSTTGWVFGTFQYEKAASTSANWWEHLVPVGLMWGSDVTRLKANQATSEEWINTARGQQLHLGRKDLVLNGPIDNPLGSCTSCHGFAQVARVNNPVPALPSGPPRLTASSASLDAYFRNVQSGAALSPDYVSVDYSLQLQLGIARAVNSGQASLPPSLNSAGPAAGRPRPVATHLQGIIRAGREQD